MRKSQIFFLMLLMLAGTGLKAQTTRTVCLSGCDFTTIQAAATAASSGDIILINVDGAFTEKGIILPEKSLTIRGLGKDKTFLQSAASRTNAAGGRIFRYLAPTGAGSNAFTFEDMTIRYAYAPFGDINASQSIGGVFQANGTLKGLVVNANRVRFTSNDNTGGNTINSGGACFYISATGTGFTYNADLTIKNCDFDNNRVANSSGSSLSDGPCFDLLGSPARITIDSCTFTNNSAYTRGGVMYVGANWTVNVSNSLFDGNTARNGDGGCFHGSSGASYQFDNCLFKNNSAVFVNLVNGNTGSGGAYYGKGAKFRSCTFFGNQAVRGGAVCRTSSAGELQIVNCTFYGNSASTSGRSLQVGNSVGAGYPLVLANNIFTNGTGTAASEIHFLYPYSQLLTNAKNYCNSITNDNPSPGNAPLFDFTSGNSTLGLSSTPADNGGFVQSLALLSSSTLKNAGTATTGSTYDITIKDQRNFSRYDGAIDVGAFEIGGLGDDKVIPAFSGGQVTNPLSTTDPVVNATISDANGIYWYPQLTDLRPKIYYRKNGGSWFNATGALISGNGLNSNWNFTMSSAAMNGISNGDQIEYYLITQDVSSNPSIASFPAGASAQNVNSVTTPPSARSYTVGSTLPVKLEKFVVSGSMNNVSIRWDVAEQINVGYYEVERSGNRYNWLALGRIPATAKRSYVLSDKQTLQGTSYYRLRSVDLDNSFSLSEVEELNLGKANNNLNVFPNPLTGQEINIAVSKKGMVQLFSPTGAIVWSNNLEAGVHKIHLPKLTAGIYHLRNAGQAVPLMVR